MLPFFSPLQRQAYYCLQIQIQTVSTSIREHVARTGDQHVLLGMCGKDGRPACAPRNVWQGQETSMCSWECAARTGDLHALLLMCGEDGRPACAAVNVRQGRETCMPS